MLKQTGFHVRHDLQPALTAELLRLLLVAPVGRTEPELHEMAVELGYKLRARSDYRKLLQSLTELDIITTEHRTFTLTQMGRTIANLVSYQYELLPEFIHFLYYTAFDYSAQKRFSWSYRVICQTLWQGSPYNIIPDRLVNIVTQAAVHEFDAEAISFSSQSVSGVLNWLLAMTPPCMIRRDKTLTFERRIYCPIETFMLALNHVYQQQEPEAYQSVALSPELKAEICQICLLSIESFSEMLDQAESCFSQLQVRRERGERIHIASFSWSHLED